MMARMREQAREEARGRAAAQSPTTQRRLRRRMTAVARRAEEELQNAAPATPRTDAVAEPTPEAAGLNHRVHVLGGTPPRGSQEEIHHHTPLKALTNAQGQSASLRGRPFRGRRGSRGSAPGTPHIAPGIVGSAEVVNTAGRGRGAIRGGRGRGTGGKRGGRRGVEDVILEPEDIPAPNGWETPIIEADQRSPILLRSRNGVRHHIAGFEAMVQNPIVLEDDSGGLGGIDIANFDGFGLMTPPRALQCSPRGTGVQRREQFHSAICKFTLEDFTPGAPDPGPLTRQSVGEYLPWLHYCGEDSCPFTEPSLEVRNAALESGRPIPGSDLSPCDHIRVDKRAFPRVVHVLVKLEAIGFDRTLWGDLECFSGVVENRYYHEVNGSPMFSVNFTGSIGVHEVKVCETELDMKKQFGGCTQRTLDFGTSASTGDGSSVGVEVSSGEVATTCVTATAVSGSANAIYHPLDPRAPLLPEDDDDEDWRGAFVDFTSPSHSGMPPSRDDEYGENPLFELGFYDAEEDLSSWSFEQVFADDQWQEPKLRLVDEPRDFTGPLPEVKFPGGGGLYDCLEYFMRFWPKEVISRIVIETNRYALQADANDANLTNGRAEWYPIDEMELKCWFGELVLMGLKDLPNQRLYWSPLEFYGCPVIKACMTQQCFEAIVRCIHLVDNSQLPPPSAVDVDKICKVRWLLKEFTRISQEQYNCQHICTVDEIMVPYKGTYCNIRQYIKAKPVKFGIKLWALASSQSQYVSNVIVYLGSGDVREESDLVGANAVLTAVRGLEGRGHVIVTDNYFTSAKLIMMLLERGFFTAGTVKKTSVGFPSSLAGFANTQQRAQGTLLVKMHRSRRIAAVCWVDRKPVWLMSTALNPIDPRCVAPRWVKRTRLDFPTSPVLLQYQGNMRGIDVVDQRRVEYTVILQSHKWWHRLLTFVVDSSLLNSFTLYHEDATSLGLQIHARQMWHYTLARGLVAPSIRPNVPCRPARNLARRGFHYAERHASIRRLCLCCRRRTYMFCGGCGGRFMCLAPCYVRVHTQPQFAALAQH